MNPKKFILGTVLVLALVLTAYNFFENQALRKQLSELNTKSEEIQSVKEKIEPTLSGVVYLSATNTQFLSTIIDFVSENPEYLKKFKAEVEKIKAEKKLTR